MKYALWDKDNTTLVSSYFLVPPHKCVLLSAIGFKQFKQQSEASFRGPQLVCVERLLYTFNKQAFKSLRDCDWIFLPRLSATEEEVANEGVASCGCYWSLDMCNNMKFVGLPGTYRLHFNDPTMVGEAQVYAELYDYEQIPPHIAGMFFQ